MIWLTHYIYSKKVNRTLSISSCGPESAPTTMYDRRTAELKWRWIEVTSHPKSSLQTFWAKYDQLWGIRSHPRPSWKNQRWIWTAPPFEHFKNLILRAKDGTRLARRTWANHHWTARTGAPRGWCQNSFGTWRADQPDTNPRKHCKETTLLTGKTTGEWQDHCL